MTRHPNHPAVTTNPDEPVFDHRHIAYVFTQRGYTVNEMASRLDLSNHTLEDILRGSGDPGELRIATLRTMAALLGIPVHGLFARPTPAEDTPEPSRTQPTRAEDAEQLIVCVYDRGRATPTLVSDLAAAFDWTLDRTYAAAREADQRLRHAGLRVNTSHGELFIAPTGTHLAAIEALEARRTYQRGLHYNQYRIVLALLRDPTAPIAQGLRTRRITLSGLVNQGVLSTTKRPELTPAALDAFPDRT